MFIVKLTGIIIIAAIIGFAVKLVLNISNLEQEIADETKQKQNKQPIEQPIDDDFYGEA